MPCSQTPPQSPAVIAHRDCLLLPSRYSTLSACGRRLTRLNRFTCVTACPSLCLRLAHVVTSISPRLDSRWGGCTPCRCGNLTRWKRQASPGAPKYLNNIVEQDHRAIKRVVRPMLAFKSFRCAAILIAGIEIIHMIKKGQVVCPKAKVLSAASQFYSLAF